MAKPEYITRIEALESTATGHDTRITAAQTTANAASTAAATAQTTANAALPKTGGTMTGALTINDQVKLTPGDNKICATNNSYYIELTGGTTYQNGAWLDLSGKDRENENGVFKLSACNGTNTSTLIGTAPGALSWAGQAIECVEAGGAGYIKYTSGLKICWVMTSFSNGDTWSYPIAFTSTPCVTASLAGSISSATYARTAHAHSVGTTNCTLQFRDIAGGTVMASTGSYLVSLIAVGY